VLPICCTPKNIKNAVNATTMNRNLRLDPTIQRIIGGLLSSVADCFFDPVQLGHADGHHLGSRRRTAGEVRDASLLPLQTDLVAFEDQGLRVRVDPPDTVRIDENRRRRNGHALRRRLDDGCLDG
jgi:hypothetical protein